MRKLCRYVLCLIACAVFAFTGCADKKDNSTSGIPNNTVPHRDENADDQTNNTSSDSSNITTGSVQGPTISDTTPTSDNFSDTEPAGTSSEEPDTDEPIYDCRAFGYLRLLNSDKVHAKLIEAVSYDNEQAVSIKRELFISGSECVFINDSQKTIISDGQATVIDLDNKTYYTIPYDDESENFGYGIDNYTFVSSSNEDDGSVIEVYDVTAHGSEIKSTWTFFPNGTITVADVSKEFGSYYWYSFDVIEDDISKMDMNMPDGLELVEPEDYF